MTVSSVSRQYIQQFMVPEGAPPPWSPQPPLAQTQPGNYRAASRPAKTSRANPTGSWERCHTTSTTQCESSKALVKTGSSQSDNGNGKLPSLAPHTGNNKQSRHLKQVTAFYIFMDFTFVRLLVCVRSFSKTSYACANS